MSSEAIPNTREAWTLADYLRLLRGLVHSTPIIGLSSFAAMEPGVWLRHDVELDTSAAMRMAQAEAAINVSATYFLSMESPFIEDNDETLRVTMSNLQELGHDVSYHLLLSPGLHTVGERLHELRKRFPRIRPQALTFHGPGVPAEVFAESPFGAPVYGPLAKHLCRYFSDSTGRWRWGDPRNGVPTDMPVQLLVHPSWWAGDFQRVVKLCATSHRHREFLPQFAALAQGEL